MANYCGKKHIVCENALPYGGCFSSACTHETPTYIPANTPCIPEKMVGTSYPVTVYMPDELVINGIHYIKKDG